MRRRIECPDCSREFVYDGPPDESFVVCPSCRAHFVLNPPLDTAGPPPSASEEAERVTAAPVGQPPAWTTPEAAALEVAGVEVDLTEDHDPDEPRGPFGVEERVARLKQVIPEVPSAYRPSGRCPPSALGWLAAGALLGALGSALAALSIGGGVAGGIYFLHWGLEKFSESSGFELAEGKVVLFYLWLIVFGVLGFAGTCYGLCAVAARTTASCGAIGKNRNARITGAFSAVAAFLGVAFLYVLLVVSSERAFGLRLEGDRSENRRGNIALFLSLLGGLAAAGVTGRLGSSATRSHKYCEGCREAMREAALPGVGVGALRALVRAVPGKDWAGTADLLGSQPGEEGKPVLFRCPCCGEGFLEVSASFRFVWTLADGTVTQINSWLAASEALDAGEMSRFAPFFPDKDRQRRG